ncbi:MAG: hypothetical protein QXS02_02640 [Candidatus Thermoplasmatota archaeon]
MIRGIKNKIISKIILFLLAGISITFSITAEAAITSDISIHPEIPSAGSDVTFYANISSDIAIDDVRLIVRECKEAICFSDIFNESMELLEPNHYYRMITLKHSDATYIEYQVKVKTEDGWSYIPDRNKYVKVTLSSQPEPDNGSNQDNNKNQDGKNKTIGFELTLSMLALIIIVLINNRRR